MRGYHLHLLHTLRILKFTAWNRIHNQGIAQGTFLFKVQSRKMSSKKGKKSDNTSTDSVPMPSSSLSQGKDGVVQLSVSVKPGSKHEGMFLSYGSVEIRTSAPAREGEANEAVIKQVSKTFGIPKTSLVLVRGHKDRQKVIALGNITVDDAYKVIQSLEED